MVELKNISPLDYNITEEMLYRFTNNRHMAAVCKIRGESQCVQNPLYKTSVNT